MFADWVHEDQLIPFVELMGHFCGCDVGPDESMDVLRGLSGSDLDEDFWFVYRVEGETPLHLRLARKPASCMIAFELHAGEQVEAQARTALEVLNHLRVRQR